MADDLILAIPRCLDNHRVVQLPSNTTSLFYRLLQITRHRLLSLHERRLAPRNQNNSENNSIPLRHHSKTNTVCTKGRLAPRNQNNSENNSIPLRHHSKTNQPAQKNANFNTTIINIIFLYMFLYILSPL
jgi:hypothetical protein